MPRVKLISPSAQEKLIAEMERNLSLDGARTDTERARLLGYEKAQYSRRFGRCQKRTDVTLPELVRIATKARLSDGQILSIFGR